MSERPAVNGPATVERLVRHYWRLAHHVALGYILREGPNGDHAAVTSDALFGLLQGARSYDASRGAEEVTHIRFCIDCEVVDGYRDRLGRVGRRTGRRRRQPMSLELLLHQPATDMEGGLDETETNVMLDQVYELFARLTHTEQEVMRAMYCEGKTQREVSVDRGVTDGAVCIVHRRAVAKLRQRLGLAQATPQPAATWQRRSDDGDTRCRAHSKPGRRPSAGAG